MYLLVCHALVFYVWHAKKTNTPVTDSPDKKRTLRMIGNDVAPNCLLKYYLIFFLDLTTIFLQNAGWFVDVYSFNLNYFAVNITVSICNQVTCFDNPSVSLVIRRNKTVHKFVFTIAALIKNNNCFRRKYFERLIIT